MRDCSNAEMRDALPDLMHGRLSAAEQIEVASHVSSCEDCAAELALLKQVRAAHDARHVVNVDRIVAALPGQRRTASWSSRPMLRIAAAIALLIGGTTLYRSFDRPDVVTVETQPQVAQVSPTPSDSIARAVQGTPAVTKTPARVAVVSGPSLDGGLDDLTDAELQSLLAALDSFEAEVDPEPETIVPVPESEDSR